MRRRHPRNISASTQEEIGGRIAEGQSRERMVAKEQADDKAADQA
jgi:hypothetical protein